MENFLIDLSVQSVKDCNTNSYPPLHQGSDGWIWIWIQISLIWTWYFRPMNNTNGIYSLTVLYMWVPFVEFSFKVHKGFFLEWEKPDWQFICPWKSNQIFSDRLSKDFFLSLLPTAPFILCCSTFFQQRAISTDFTLSQNSIERKVRVSEGKWAWQAFKSLFSLHGMNNKKLWLNLRSNSNLNCLPRYGERKMCLEGG